MSCVDCGSGSHEECVHTDNDGKCCCLNGDELGFSEESDDEDEDYGNWRRGRRAATLKDQQSTGRKRAAQLYPLNRDAACEWRNLKAAGGGKYPIVGCRNGLQRARHHGPDKNTLNNDSGNVHRICNHCHNRWHAKNDTEYEAGVIPFKHDAKTEATLEDFLESELYWSRNKPRKVGKD